MNFARSAARQALLSPLLVLTFAGPSIAQADERAPDRIARALDGMDPRFAYAVAIVPLDGEPVLRVAGRVDEEIAFDTWQYVPLGVASRFFLDVALARAMAAGTLKANEPVISGDEPGAKTLAFADLCEFVGTTWPSLPAYDRFAYDATGLRSVAEVVTAHGFVSDESRGDSGQLQVALAQHALQRVTDQTWTELLAESAREFGMQTVLDLTSSTPRRPVAWGRREDASDFPLRLHEVPAAGNVACAVDELVPLVRHCMREILADDEHEPGAVRIAARFDDDLDPRFGVSTFRFRSDWCGATLLIDVLPAQRTAVVIFGARARGDWLQRLRDETFAVVLRREPQEVEPGLGFGGRGIPRPATLHGTFHGVVHVDGRALEVEMSTESRVFGLLHPQARVRGMEEGCDTIVSGRYARASFPVPQPLDAEFAVQIHLSVSGERDDADELAGVASVERTMPDGLRVELLPQRVVLRRVKAK